MRYRLYHDPSTSNTATIFTDTLDGYSQDAAVSINSDDNDIQLKTRSTTRLQVQNTGGGAPGRIDLNIGDLTGDSDTTHGELRFCRGDNPSIRYHSILTKHSNVASRCALLFKIHDSTVSSDNTGQREVLKLQSDGNCGINLDGGNPTETLEVNGTVKCTELKFDDVDGVTTNLSSVISDLLLRVAELEDRFGIDIITGVNDTLMFQHVITSAASPNVISYMYTIVLAGQRYTTDEMLTAINAAIVTAGSVQNSITTTMAFSGDRFIIRCTADTSVFFSIQVVQGSSSAAESIGFVQNRVQQGSTGGDLDLVATNTVLFAIRDAT